MDQLLDFFSSPMGVAILVLLASVAWLYCVLRRSNQEPQLVSGRKGPLASYAIIGSHGSGPGQFNNPSHVVLDRAGMMYVSDRDNMRIQKLNSEGEYMTHWLTKGFQPGALAVDHQHNELVCVKRRDYFITNELIIYSLDKQLNRSLTVSNMKEIIGLAVNSHGQIVCSDGNTHFICIVSRDGDILHKFGEEGSGPGQFSLPHALCIGPGDDIVVADTWNCRIQVFDQRGRFKHKFDKVDGKGQFRQPVYVTMNQHQILVSDRSSKDVQVFSYKGALVSSISCSDERKYLGGLAATKDYVLRADSSSHCLIKVKYT